MAKNKSKGAEEKSSAKGGIISDLTGKINIAAALKLVEDLYAVLKKDIPDVLKPSVQGTMPTAKGCCDHKKCIQMSACLTAQSLGIQLRHLEECEKECDDSDGCDTDDKS